MNTIHLLLLVQVSVKVGTTYLPMSITVMEKGPDFLFGLDMLRRYQCNIDLKANKLRFQVEPEVALPFLAEHELPDSVRFEMQGEPEAGARRVPSNAPFLHYTDLEKENHRHADKASACDER